jgi:hypothetical protein
MLKRLSIASCIDRLYRYSKAPVEIFLASLGAPRSRHRLPCAWPRCITARDKAPQCGHYFGAQTLETALISAFFESTADTSDPCIES